MHPRRARARGHVFDIEFDTAGQFSNELLLEALDYLRRSPASSRVLRRAVQAAEGLPRGSAIHLFSRFSTHRQRLCAISIDRL
jgi:hypothetical protein